MGVNRIDEGLFRVLIPFEELTTTVYFAISEEGTAIIDSGTYPSDVHGYILPALKGIGKYRDGVQYRADYIKSVNRLRTMNIQRIVASHEYDPYGSTAEGEEVQKYLDGCVEFA